MSYIQSNDYSYVNQEKDDNNWERDLERLINTHTLDVSTSTSIYCMDKEGRKV
jgi:hypothetical protein